MSQFSSLQPTDDEMRVLRILWQYGPSRACEIHDWLRVTGETTYASTMKMLAGMVQKRLLRLDDSVHPRVFRPATSRAWMQQQVLQAMILDAYEGER